LNIIDATSIRTGAKATLTLQGGPGDFVILRVAKGFTLGAKSTLNLGGGLVPSHVLVMVGGTTTLGARVSMAGGIVSLGGGCIAATGAAIAGAMLCDKKVTMSGAVLNYVSPGF